MPCTEQEHHSIHLACDWLADHCGGVWGVEENLDETNYSRATPEVLLGNGELTAAVEVKRLIHDPEFLASLLGNERYLAPSCGGYYLLCPPSGFQIDMQRGRRRWLKDQIELVAPTIAPGEITGIRSKRRGRVDVFSKSGELQAHCLHCGPVSTFWEPLTGRIRGRLWLHDGDWDHRFVTAEAETSFYESLRELCDRLDSGESEELIWDEEWYFQRVDDITDEDQTPGVQILTVTDAFNLADATREAFTRVSESVRRKFEERWADLHVLVLVASHSTPARQVTSLFQGITAEDLPGTDLVLVEDETHGPLKNVFSRNHA